MQTDTIVDLNHNLIRSSADKLAGLLVGAWGRTKRNNVSIRISNGTEVDSLKTLN